MGIEDKSGGPPIITSGWIRALAITGVGGGLATLLPMIMETRYHQMVEETGQGTNGPLGAILMAVLIAMTIGIIGGLTLGSTSGPRGTRLLTRVGLAALGVVASASIWALCGTLGWLAVRPSSPQGIAPGGVWALLYAMIAAPASLIGALTRRGSERRTDDGATGPAR